MGWIEVNRERRGHEFLPPPQERGPIPRPYATEGIPAAETIAHVHYFGGPLDIYVLEMSTEPDEDGDYEIFCYARLANFPEGAEYGLHFLAAYERLVFGPGGMFVLERDLDWTPKPMAEVLRALEKSE